MSLSLVDRTTLDELGAVIGVEKLARLIDRFVVSLAAAFEGGERTAADYAREAHTMISMSGMLGCASLSQACRGLEQAGNAGGDIGVQLGEVRVLRDGTVAALRELRAETGGDR